MLCRHCGNEIAEGTFFCTSCGKNIFKANKDAEEISRLKNELHQAHERLNKTSELHAEVNSKRTARYVAAIAILGVACILLGFGWLSSNDMAKGYRSTNEELSRDVAKLDASNVDQMTAKNKELQNSVQQLTAENEELQGKVNDLQKSYSELQSTYNSMYNSNSEKIQTLQSFADVVAPDGLCVKIGSFWNGTYGNEKISDDLVASKINYLWFDYQVVSPNGLGIYSGKEIEIRIYENGVLSKWEKSPATCSVAEEITSGKRSRGWGSESIGRHYKPGYCTIQFVYNNKVVGEKTVTIQ